MIDYTIIILGVSIIFFTEILLVGSGTIACDCLNEIVRYVNGSNIHVMEIVESSLSFLKEQCKKNSVEYIPCLRENILEHFMRYTKEGEILIISVNNEYIFPAELVKQENVTIINFHYSLLPAYRGVNIPTWVIYNEEKYTGVTWHYATDQIDHGKIIAQKEIEITESTTAFDIVRKGMKIGNILFVDFIKELLNGEKMGYDVEYSVDSKLFRKSILPQGGVLDLTDTAHNIQKLLRAYDYHGSNVIPPLKTKIKDQLWQVVRYEIREQKDTELPEMDFMENDLIVNKDGGKIHIVLRKV